MLKNFILSRDDIKQAIEQFTTRKIVEVVCEMLGLEPQRSDGGQSLGIVGPLEVIIGENSQ